jgi:VWFA-related protein
MVAIVPLRVRVLVMAVISAFATGTLAAQQEASSKPELAGKIVFKASVRRVIVDVVVTGADGKPVPSLRAADFTVAEDGKPQKILSFDVHDFEPVSDSLPKRPDLPVNTFINLPSGPERGPLYVLLLDLLNMEVNDQPAARKQILNFVLSKPLGTRFAIFVLSDGVHLVQGFTEERA